jgi:hypothetical protein
MEHRNTSADNEGSESSKKNADNQKLGDKIGPAKKNDRERNNKDRPDERDSARSDKKKNDR